MPKTIITFDIELTEEEIKKGKEFLDELLHDIYTAGENQRYVLELTDYSILDEVFEAFMLTLGLEV